MVQQIMHDPLFLAQKSELATKADLQVGKDLQDTLKAHREGCVGMAANMIGVKKNIIIVNMGFFDVVMFNPVIVSKSGVYETEEGCLSLSGIRKTTRFENIEVEYQDFSWKKQRQMCIRDRPWMIWKKNGVKSTLLPLDPGEITGHNYPHILNIHLLSLIHISEPTRPTT